MLSQLKIITICGLIIIIGFSHPIRLNAQQYNFKNYSVENGLPYIQIFTLFQDNLGYLWSGGYGGASKFNGKTFQHYSPKNGLANHYVNCITQHNNQVLIGTIDGLSIIDNYSKKITANYTIKEGLPSNKIIALCSDLKSRTWIGTSVGLCYLENKKIILSKKLNNTAINCLNYSTDNGLWIGTKNGLFNLKNDQLILYTTTEGLSDNNITCLAKNYVTNELIIGTKNGL
nr:hypothetical protein [Bacteroidia bacterium]